MYGNNILVVKVIHMANSKQAAPVTKSCYEYESKNTD